MAMSSPAPRPVSWLAPASLLAALGLLLTLGACAPLL